MKNPRVPLTLLFLTGSFVFAQAPVPGADTPVEAGPAAPPAVALRSAEELDQLLAPIALYPDALIAIILPAATAPADIVLAARELRDSPGDRSQIEHRAWDDSVKSLTNYPEVLKWMDENLQWTKQVGEAFAAQQADVMQAMQRLRAKARAAGTLVDTPQQQVIAEPDAIRIVPAQPDVIYVPYYQPEVVFVDRPVYYTQPFLSFGVGVPVGSWLAFECDWRRHTIWVGNRHRPWATPDWHRPIVPLGPTYVGPRFTRAPDVRQWRPAVAPARTVVNVNIVRRTPPPVVRPTPINAVPVSNTYVSRGGVVTSRAPALQTTTAADTAPRTFTPGHRGSRTTPPPVATAPTTTPTIAPATTFAPSAVTTASTTTAAQATTPPPPAQRRGGTEWSRDHDNRAHPYSRSGNNAPALATQPATAPGPASPPVQVIAPPVHSAPAYTYSHGQYSPPTQAPNVAVAAPPVMRHVAPPPAQPVQVVPAPAPAAAPQAAPAPQPAANTNSNANTSVGHRGARRVNEN